MKNDPILFSSFHSRFLMHSHQIYTSRRFKSDMIIMIFLCSDSQTNGIWEWCSIHCKIRQQWTLSGDTSRWFQNCYYCFWWPNFIIHLNRWEYDGNLIRQNFIGNRTRWRGTTRTPIGKKNIQKSQCICWHTSKRAETVQCVITRARIVMHLHILAIFRAYFQQFFQFAGVFERFFIYIGLFSCRFSCIFQSFLCMFVQNVK